MFVPAHAYAFAGNFGRYASATTRQGQSTLHACLPDPTKGKTGQRSKDTRTGPLTSLNLARRLLGILLKRWILCSSAADAQLKKAGY